MNRLTEVVKTLLILNVIMFFGTSMLSKEMSDTLSLFYPVSSSFQPFQLVTHMFMHGSISHLFFNMFALFMFGTALESLWGPKKFLFYYFFTGFGAVALHLLVKFILINNLEPVSIDAYQSMLSEGRGVILSGQNYVGKLGAFNGIINVPALGASGAVFGLLAGYGMKFPNTVLHLMLPPISLKAKYFVLIYAGVELFLGISGTQSGVAHFAHLGGALFGYLIIQYWMKTGK